MQRRKIAAWMEIYSPPTIVRDKYEAYFKSDPPSRLTIYRIYEKFVDTGSVADNYRGNSGRPRTGRSLENTATVQDVFSQSPRTSTRRFSAEYGLPQATTWRILKHDLHMNPYHVQCVQALSPEDNISRISACNLFLEMKNIDPTIDRSVVFTDEATFYVSGRLNKRNCITWGAENPCSVREHERASPKLNVWCAVAATGLVGPYFFDNDIITADDILDMLKNFAEENLPLRILQSGYFQLDGAPPHFSLMVRGYLNETFPRRWIGRGGFLPWPARSPDLTPCDFWLWGMVKERVYSTKPRSVQDLKQRIIDVMARIPPEMCLRALLTTWDRFQKCVDANGVYNPLFEVLNAAWLG